MNGNEGRVALVTGAGMGIGRAVALTLAEAGYDVTVHCNGSVERAQAVRQEIQAMGRCCEIVRADLSRPEEAAALFERHEALFGRLDVFVANAGLTVKGRFEEMRAEEIDRVFSVNFRGTYLCIQRAAALMRKCGARGSIVVISSNHYRMHHPLCSVYASLKAGLNKMAEHAALEYGKYGIRVNVIAPGWTDTGEARLGEKEPTYYHIPLRRWCRPEEIGQAALFLSGPWAGSITGAVLTMDGGASLMSDSLDKYGYERQEEEP